MLQSLRLTRGEVFDYRPENEDSFLKDVSFYFIGYFVIPLLAKSSSVTISSVANVATRHHIVMIRQPGFGIISPVDGKDYLRRGSTHRIQKYLVENEYIKNSLIFTSFKTPIKTFSFIEIEVTGAALLNHLLAYDHSCECGRVAKNDIQLLLLY